jgi:serine protease Do
MEDTLNRVLSPSISSGTAFTDVAEALRRVTAEIRGTEGSRGSGVVWRSDGLILTNAHVVRGPVMVQLHDGRALRADVMQRDAGADLAALRVPASGLESAELRDSKTLRPGEVVIAVGHPLGVMGAVSAGIVHGAPGKSWIESDIRLAPGNSGGPLADAAGRVVGINSMVVNGMGVAVSTAAVEEFLRPRKRARLGVTVRAVAVKVQRATMFGLLVVELEAGGAAHLDGVLVGDVLVGVAGRLFASVNDLAEAIEESNGDLRLDIFRGGAVQTFGLALRREGVAAEGAA